MEGRVRKKKKIVNFAIMHLNIFYRDKVIGHQVIQH